MIKFLIISLLLFSAPLSLATNNTNDNRATLLMDFNSKHILYEENSALIRYPASLTKIMTSYIIFENLKKGKIKLTQKVTVSKYASSQIPAKINLQEGEVVKIKDLIRATIISSANDAAVAAAEFIAGSEAKFAEIMNKKAKELGLKNTNFKNATGLHNPEHVTTAMDMATLTIKIFNDFPEYCNFFSETHFLLKGVVYKGRNIITEVYGNMVDGVKTGFTNAAGYNIITSAEKDNKKLIAIIMGRSSPKTRDLDTILLLKKGFNDDKPKQPLIIAPWKQLNKNESLQKI